MGLTLTYVSNVADLLEINFATARRTNLRHVKDCTLCNKTGLERRCRRLNVEIRSPEA
jgi:hypothetical protein